MLMGISLWLYVNAIILHIGAKINAINYTAKKEILIRNDASYD